MRQRAWLLATGFCLVLSPALALPALAEGTHKFVGAEKCKMCHNSPAKGAQYTKWTEAKHSKAYAALGQALIAHPNPQSGAAK